MFSANDRATPNDLRTLRRSLVSVALPRTHNLADAEDLVQSALVRYWENSHRLRDDTNLAGWLHVVIRNLAMDDHRRTSLVLRSGRALRTSITHDAYQTVTWEYLGFEDIQHAMNACRPSLRSAFAMFYFERLSLREIAERCNISPVTAGTRLHRARKAVRGALEQIVAAQAA